MKRINAPTSNKMYMFTLFKDSVLMLVCICVVIPSWFNLRNVSRLVCPKSESNKYEFCGSFRQPYTTQPYISVSFTSDSIFLHSRLLTCTIIMLWYVITGSM